MTSAKPQPHSGHAVADRPVVERYEILERLGAGAMGVVYRATDPELGRSVALKFLDDQRTADAPTRERFVQEAQTLSRLDHPNICTIFEIGTAADGQQFIAMAYYEGETLEERISKGPMPLSEVTDIGLQMARGLSKAHRTGVLHRDIKPANLILTEDGIVKILDFGIAKVRDRRLTRAGATLGTIGYMSPEQLDGAELDASADLWSVGVVLHEMMTARPVFGEGSEWKVMSAIVMGEFTPVAELRPDCPPALDDLILRCLAPQRANRLASADQLAEILEGIHRELPRSTSRGTALRPVVQEPRRPPTSDRVIVVRPFERFSSGPDEAEDEQFLDGLTEEIITDLSRVDALRVIARNSASLLKTMDKSTSEVAEMMGARYVVEGGLRRQRDRLRITARLLDGITEEPLWAERFDGTLDDIFDVQERVALAIVDALELELSPTEREGLQSRTIEDTRAFEAYVKARQYIWGMTSESLDRAEVLLEKGLELAGRNPRVLAGLGLVRFHRLNLGLVGPEVMEEADRLGREALALDPRSAEAEHLLALIAAGRGAIVEATPHLRRAVELDPGNVDALSALVLFYGFLGKTAHAFSLLDRLVRLDPLSPAHKGTLGWVHLMDGRANQAAEAYAETVQIMGEAPVYHMYHALAEAHAGRRESAAGILRRVLDSHGHQPSTMLLSVLAPVLEGDIEGAIEACTDDVRAVSGAGVFGAWLMAGCMASIGRTDEALDHLETATNLGFLNYPFLAHLDPLLEGIRSEPRFVTLMQDVRTRWETIDVH
jgi:serine/threonine protein kinase/tetratricopeptide (TPR) repeat protein